MKRHSLPGTALLFAPSAVSAQEAVAVGADTAWLLTATALVLFMTLPGLALFYGGLVRSKNVLSVLMQCFAIACLASVLWVVCGYSIAFGDGGVAQAWWGGLGKSLLGGVGRDAVSGTVPETVFVMFQMTFAIITPALVVGAFAERMRFTALLWFSGLWVLVVYAPLCHWVWGGGFLAQLGLMDFAGGTVVHISAGVAALVAALVLGRRSGFPDTQMMPHNLTLTVTGAAMLWVGWFGFNAGSALAADGSAGSAMLATHLGAASGSLAWMAAEWLRHGKPSVLGIVTGMVAGLGTITPASGYVGPLGALAIGTAAGFVCFEATRLVKRRFVVDDSLDVFPVHGVGGMLGTLLTAVFAAQALGGSGVEGGIARQLGVQAIGVLAAAAWAGGVTWLLLKAIGAMVGLRVDREIEITGLDVSLHDERGYDLP